MSEDFYWFSMCMHYNKQVYKNHGCSCIFQKKSQRIVEWLSHCHRAPVNVPSYPTHPLVICKQILFCYNLPERWITFAILRHMKEATLCTQLFFPFIQPVPWIRAVNNTASQCHCSICFSRQLIIVLVFQERQLLRDCLVCACALRNC